MQTPLQNFDAVAWVRQVRDANYKRLGHLSPIEYFKRLIREGEQSKLAIELEARRRPHKAV